MKKFSSGLLLLATTIILSGCFDGNLDGLIKHMKENAPYNQENPPQKLTGSFVGANVCVRFFIATDVVYDICEWDDSSKQQYATYKNGKFGLMFNTRNTPKGAVDLIVKAFEDY